MELLSVLQDEGELRGVIVCLGVRSTNKDWTVATYSKGHLFIIIGFSRKDKSIKIIFSFKADIITYSIETLL